LKPFIYPIFSLLFAFHCWAERSVFILNTTDIHSKLENYEDEYGRISNILRLSFALKKRSYEIGKEKLIVIDNGDILQGTLPSVVSKGKLGFLFLANCEYDILVPGNHDFDFGFDRFNELSSEFSQINILSLNLKLDRSKKWILIEKNGLKIAVIGMTLPYLKYFNTIADEFKVGEAENELAKIIPDVMRTYPSAIILVAHHGLFLPSTRGGLNFEKIATQYPQINLFLGGHSHEENPGQKIGPASWFVQAGSHAKLFSEIEMIFDEKDNEHYKLKDIKSKIVEINKNISEDYNLYCQISRILEDSDRLSKEILGYTKKLIPAIESNFFDSDIHHLISNAISDAAGVKCAFSSVGTGIANFTYEITYADLFKLLPYEDTVCTLSLSFDEFKSIVSEQITNKEESRINIYPWGVFCKFGMDKNLKSVYFPDGSLFDNTKRIEFAFSSFAIYGVGGRFPVLSSIAEKTDCKFHNTGIKIRDAVAEFIRKNSSLNLKKTKWLIFEEK